MLTKFTFALTALVLCFSVKAKADTALEAANLLSRKFGSHFNKSVISVTGKLGVPIPKSWDVLAYDKEVPGRLVQFEIANGKVARFYFLSPEDSKRFAQHPITVSQLKVDSSQVFSRSERIARLARVGFDHLDYVLAFDARAGVPVYQIKLIRQATGVVGELAFSAINGEQIYTNWPSPAGQVMGSATNGFKKATFAAGEGLQRLGEKMGSLFYPAAPQGSAYDYPAR